MVYDLRQVTHILIERLEKKGMESGIIHGFIRDLANTIVVNPHMNLLQVNKQLHLLGWDSFELDYHTLQLAIACFETDARESLENPSYSLLGIDGGLHETSVNAESTQVEYQ